MRRREFITLIGGMAVAWPLAADAQHQADRIRRVGFLSTGETNDAFAKANIRAFTEGLIALGWKDGVNLHIDWRLFGGDVALAQRQAEELIALGPEVVLAGGNTSVEEVRRKTRTIPIVFTLVSDPMGMGYVDSLARPGGNITGFSSYDPPIYTKQLQMFTDITPPVATVATLYNPDTASYASRMMRAIIDAAKFFGVAVHDAPCHDDAEIEAVMVALARDGGGGLLALGDVFNQIHYEQIVALALKYKIPTLVHSRQATASGGLMSYSVDFPDLYRRSASYVDRILKGAKPSDLPVQRPDKFWTAINLKTANALGVKVSSSLLNTADEVFE